MSEQKFQDVLELSALRSGDVATMLKGDINDVIQIPNYDYVMCKDSDNGVDLIKQGVVSVDVKVKKDGKKKETKTYKFTDKVYEEGVIEFACN